MVEVQPRSISCSCSLYILTHFTKHCIFTPLVASLQVHSFNRLSSSSFKVRDLYRVQVFQAFVPNIIEMASFRAIAFLALTTGFASIANAQASGSGTTTRYWDCCKGSCSWSGKADVSNPVTTCDIDDTPLTDSNAVSGCESGGTAFMCSDQSPWAANDTLAFGFAAVNIAGGSESSWCCACYK